MSRHFKRNLIVVLMALFALESPRQVRAFGAKRAPATPLSAIQHLVVIVQENHSFDSYFGRYCHAPSGSEPSCESGPDCCEAGPDFEPGTHRAPVTLDDAGNIGYDPDHSQACELAEIDGGRMDRYTDGLGCSNPRNFVYATAVSAAYYWRLASEGALADRYFQPVAGASSANDMYLARAQYVFTDNQVAPASVGSRCGESPNTNRRTYDDPTIGDLLSRAGFGWAFYAEGYQTMLDAQARGQCPLPDAECPAGADSYPCIYDPSDNPFQYYRPWVDNRSVERDYAAFARDIAAGQLPAVSFVKPLGFRTEHPGCGTIGAGEAFVQGTIDAIERSPYAASTLILVTFDESGGYFDHVPPPRAPGADGQPYGPRIPLIAVGPFARHGAVSHAVMEHSSIVKFIEWNWLGGTTGQLRGRDAVVNNLGSLLDPAAARARVP